MGSNKIPIISTTKLEKVKNCNASNAKPEPRVNSGTLTRWGILNDAIGDWLNNDAPEETAIKKAENEHFGSFDDLQKRILSNMFSDFRVLYPKRKAEIDIDFPSKTVFKEINGEEHGMSAYFQYQVSDKNTIENIKLKIGRPDINEIDRAIYSADKLDNETFYAGAVANTELIEIEDIENPQNIIDDYFDIYEDFLENPNKTTPGSHCLSKCGRPAVCGEFPVIGDEKINTRYRGITVSKTNIRDVEKCERKASWNFQYSIPRDKEDSFSGDFGITFHYVAQTMLVNNNNRNDEGEKERLASLIENEDDDTQKKIFKKYEELLEKLKGYENLDITLSEYPVGFTPITQGLIANKDLTVKEGRVATSFIGKADLLGRLDGVPIVIELKTGKKHPGDLTEAELYALGVSKRLKAKEVIVLHIYVNEDKDEANERRFGEDEFISIEKKFESFAEKIASWNPNDALSPSYEVGDWCNYCEFQETCAEFR